LRFVHLHGASIGESQCLLRLVDELQRSFTFSDTEFWLTYTSSSVPAWLEAVGRSGQVAAYRWNRETHRSLSAHIGRIAGKERACIIAEKDRRPHLLALHRDSKFVLNIEAKPPQSWRSKIFEDFVVRSIPRVTHFAVENERYESDIRRRAPRAPIFKLGTLKAPASQNGTRGSLLPHVAFLSVMAHEAGTVAAIIRDVERAVPDVRAIVVPRYVGPASWPWKNGERFVRKFAAGFTGATVVTTVEELTSRLNVRTKGPIVYAGFGKVPDILHLTRVAVVGGSLRRGILSRAKGHNFLEPLAAGVPTIIGPWVQNWLYSVRSFTSDGSLLLARRRRTVARQISRLLQDDEAYRQQVEAVRSSTLLRFHQGATARVAALVAHLVTADNPAEAGSHLERIYEPAETGGRDARAKVEVVTRPEEHGDVL
jgi:3-deoxy-D-manno-octulosonic-acid transferase